MKDTCSCPGCGRQLELSGRIEFDGEAGALYTCQQCVNQIGQARRLVKCRLTFAVLENGNYVMPGCIAAESEGANLAVAKQPRNYSRAIVRFTPAI